MRLRQLMLSTMLNGRRLALFIAMSLALVATLAAVAIASRQAIDTNHAQGTAFGKARVSADDDVVLRVNGYPITNAELVESRLRYYRNLESMRSAAARAVPADQWDEVASDADFASNDPRSPIHEYMITDGFTAYIRALEKYGGDVVGLAALIADYAEFSAAIDAGHSASEVEVAEYVEMTRDALNRQSASAAFDWGMLPEMQGYIDAVGENRFWSEIYPERLARDIAIGKWHQAAISEYNGGEDIALHAETADKILRELTLSALDNADIEIVDAEKARVNPDDALAYLRELYAEVYPLDWSAGAESGSRSAALPGASQAAGDTDAR